MAKKLTYADVKMYYYPNGIFTPDAHEKREYLGIIRHWSNGRKEYIDWYTDKPEFKAGRK